MKKILVILFLSAAVPASAQSLIDSLSNPGFTLQDTLAEKLAEVALTANPNLKLADRQVEAGLYGWQRSKSVMFNNVQASFNLNEGNINPPEDRVNLFYPRYNLSLNLPLGLLVTRPKDIKIAQANYEGAKAAKEVQINNLKQQIKVAYQNYQASKYLLALQETVLQDEAVLLSQVQQKFETNQVSLETFTNASKRYNAELVKKVNLLRDVNTTKADLEYLLGMTLETALQRVRQTPQGPARR
jgi:outer membrane protein TolC